MIARRLEPRLTGPVLAATYSGGVLLAGNLAGEVLRLSQRALSEGNAGTASALRWVHYILPDLQALSLRSEAANHLATPDGFILQALVYAVCYGGAALILAMWVFTRREVF